jgi:hypothetical protein
MYLLLVYNDYERKDLIFIGQFKMIKDIATFTNDRIRYSDRIENKQKCYKTYKNLFKVVKINKSIFNDNSKYFKRYYNN